MEKLGHSHEFPSMNLLGLPMKKFAMCKVLEHVENCVLQQKVMCAGTNH